MKTLAVFRTAYWLLYPIIFYWTRYLLLEGSIGTDYQQWMYKAFSKLLTIDAWIILCCIRQDSPHWCRFSWPSNFVASQFDKLDTSQEVNKQNWVGSWQPCQEKASVNLNGELCPCPLVSMGPLPQSSLLLLLVFCLFCCFGEAI